MVEPTRRPEALTARVTVLVKVDKKLKAALLEAKLPEAMEVDAL